MANHMGERFFSVSIPSSTTSDKNSYSLNDTMYYKFVDCPCGHKNNYKCVLESKENWREKRTKGFSLIELLITLAIIALLAVLVVPPAQIYLQRRDEMELRRALHEIRKAIDAYKIASNEGRIVTSPGATGYPPTLESLAEGVTDQRSPSKLKIYFLRRVPRDPFNTDSNLTNAETWGKRSYASDPSNPLPGDDVYDVYTTSPQIGLNEIPYRRW